jgi:hypothetical protein
MHASPTPSQVNGALALFCGQTLPLEIHQSAAGFYLGTYRFDVEMGCPMPYTRESNEYWRSHQLAENALSTGAWSQKRNL